VTAQPHLPLPPELPLVDEPGGADDGPEGGSLRNHVGTRERRVEYSTDVDLTTQIIRFVLTGALSAVVDFGLYLVLWKGLGLERDIAKACSFIAGTTTAYLINRRWTFKAEPSRSRFIAVVILYAITFAAQVGINAVLNMSLPAMKLHVGGHSVALAVLVAFVVAQGVATVINFVVQRAVIFKIH
jgi:putative flippase GtrA